MAKLEVALLVGEESKLWLQNVEACITKLEKLTGKAVKVAALDDDDEDTTDDTDDDEDFAPKKNKKTTMKAKSFDDDEDETENDEEPAPRKRAKKLTIDDVNDACVARAKETGGKEGKKEVLNILKKKFKTTSVTDLEPDQYAAVIAEMQS